MNASSFTPQPSPVNGFRVFRGIVVGSLTAIAVGLGGFRVIHDETGAMGLVLFFGLPFITGLATAVVTRGKEVIFASLWIGAIAATAVLIITRMEGGVCVLMSAPLIAFSLTLGALFGVLLRKFLLARSRSLMFRPPVALVPGRELRAHD